MAAFAVAFFSSVNGGRVGPASVGLPPGRIAVEMPLGPAATTALRVPSIGLDTRGLAELGQDADHRLEVPRDAATVGHYAEGASAGEPGPAVYASHVVYRGVEGGFARLAEVEVGDQVLVDRSDGVTVVFRVDRVAQVDKDAFPTRAVYGPTASPELRLITCGGTFDTDADSYEDNVVVYGTGLEAYRP
ncbi:sortase domain-bontaining protein [Actinomycetospora callitridis]|uniref:sortase domain-containing protein n=1 Tax=Actinomycetospora callitridis TaxID=913944 RepID=UPI0023670D0A|nr:sortase [Actinomycetospora callitridis]MDD7919791.1 sortase [Actinomycetospora callitridis]